MTTQETAYVLDGVQYDELVTFEEFVKQCVARPRDRGHGYHKWSLAFRGYPVAPDIDDKSKYEICINGASFTLNSKAVLLIRERNKIVFNSKDNVEKIAATTSRPFRREDVFEAMRQSGFKRTRSCCPAELEKMCTQDEYRGDLGALIKTYLRIAGYRR